MKTQIDGRPRHAWTVLASAIACALAVAAPAAAQSPPGQVREQTISVAGLSGPARILRDVDGMPHVEARNERDALFLQGWLQAQDRLFQLDVLRRQVSGTLAELVGPGAIASDVQLRTIGLRRAAERSWAALTPETKAGLQAYSDGVNAYVKWAGKLPAQYAALETTKFEPWSPLDSVVIGKGLAFQLSFDLDDGATRDYLTYQAVLAPALGKAGADAAFFADVFRAAPFSPASTVPDAMQSPFAVGGAAPAAEGRASGVAPGVSPDAVERLKRVRERMQQVPFLDRTLRREDEQIGSNEWAVSGKYTVDGRPLVANDPHLGLDLPATFYQLQLRGRDDGFRAIGSSVTGTPWVVLGQNDYVTWGETTTGFDVTDVYEEKIQALPDGRLFTVYKGALEPVQALPVTFRYNVIGDGKADNLQVQTSGVPPVVLIVPRRNNGPIVDISVNPATGVGTAYSVQYAGFGPTRELDTFRLLNGAKNLQDFVAALQYFDVGSQNFIYGDIEGNVGYFTSGEVPLREDLQAGTRGAPWFVRSGQGGQEWLRKQAPGPLDGTGYEYLPFDELPQVVNPTRGFVVNANNDPAGLTLDNDPLNTLRKGGGIYYLGYAFDFGTRAGRITQALEERLAKGRVSRADMKAVQADVKMLDAEVLTPYILGAFENATRPGANPALAALASQPRIAEAVARLAAWNHTAPTGVVEGYDAVDVDGQRLAPSASEAAHSVAATIYSVWRGQAIRRGVDAALTSRGLPTPGSGEAIKALKHLLARNGVGVSSLDFFAAAALPTPAERRDFVVLRSLADALDRLAGAPFAAAFGNSTNQADYRWGKLHRIVFDGLVVGGPFSIPGATPGFPPAFAGLPGLSTDGGFGVVDASSHNPRAQSVNEFTFGSGPNRRYVGSPGTAPGTIEAETSLPGGMSGDLQSPFYANLLGRWLTNDTYPLRQEPGEVMQALHSQQHFQPAK
jgi:penicillin amidase